VPGREIARLNEMDLGSVYTATGMVWEASHRQSWWRVFVLGKPLRGLRSSRLGPTDRMAAAAVWRLSREGFPRAICP